MADQMIDAHIAGMSPAEVNRYIEGLKSIIQIKQTKIKNLLVLDDKNQKTIEQYHGKIEELEYAIKSVIKNNENVNDGENENDENTTIVTINSKNCPDSETAPATVIDVLLQSANQHVKENETQIKELRDLNESLTKEIQDVTLKYYQLEAQLKIVQNELRLSQHTVSNQATELLTHKAHYDSLHSQFTLYESDRHLLSQEHLSLQQRHASLVQSTAKSTMIQFTNIIDIQDELCQEIEILRKQLSISTIEIQQNNNLINELSNEIKILKNENALLKAVPSSNEVTSSETTKDTVSKDPPTITPVLEDVSLADKKSFFESQAALQSPTKSVKKIKTVKDQLADSSAAIAALQAEVQERQLSLDMEKQENINLNNRYNDLFNNYNRLKINIKETQENINDIINKKLIYFQNTNILLFEELAQVQKKQLKNYHQYSQQYNETLSKLHESIQTSTSDHHQLQVILHQKNLEMKTLQLKNNDLQQSLTRSQNQIHSLEVKYKEDLHEYDHLRKMVIESEVYYKSLCIQNKSLTTENKLLLHRFRKTEKRLEEVNGVVDVLLKTKSTKSTIAAEIIDRRSEENSKTDERLNESLSSSPMHRFHTKSRTLTSSTARHSSSTPPVRPAPANLSSYERALLKQQGSSKSNGSPLTSSIVNASSSTSLSPSGSPSSILQHPTSIILERDFLRDEVKQLQQQLYQTREEWKLYYGKIEKLKDAKLYYRSADNDDDEK